MLRLFQACYWWLVRMLAWLRYRVDVIGLEKLRDLHGPTLVMPNHPAYIDPPLLLSHLRLHAADPADRVRGNVPQGDTVSHDAAGRGPRSPRPGRTQPQRPGTDPGDDRRGRRRPGAGRELPDLSGWPHPGTGNRRDRPGSIRGGDPRTLAAGQPGPDPHPGLVGESRSA